MTTESKVPRTAKRTKQKDEEFGSFLNLAVERWLSGETDDEPESMKQRAKPNRGLILIQGGKQKAADQR